VEQSCFYKYTEGNYDVKSSYLAALLIFLASLIIKNYGGHYILLSETKKHHYNFFQRGEDKSKEKLDT
jgi:hypothetical protein